MATGTIKAVSSKADLNAYVYGGLLPTGTDMDDVVTPGIYFLSSSYTYTNTPVTLSTLIVEKGYQTGNAILQIGISTGSIWFRYRTSSTNWDSWRPVTSSRGWAPNGANIDTLAVGVWGLSSNNTYQGTLPSGVNSGFLEVFSPSISGSYAMQRLTKYDGSGVYLRYRGGDESVSWGAWTELTAIRTPSNPTYDSTKVNTSSSATYVTVKRVGKIVHIGGGFHASADIPVSTPTKIASGFPASLSQSQGSMVAINGSKKQPVSLMITSSGELQTYYSGETIEAGNTVRYSLTYFTDDP